MSRPGSLEKPRVVDTETSHEEALKEAKPGKHAKLRNPLADLSKDELFADVETFAREKGLEDILGDLKKGALVAQDPKTFESLEELSESEKELLRREKTHRWSQPFMLYFMTGKHVNRAGLINQSTHTSLVLCAGSAIVQGMDQTAVNGAQE